MYDFHKMQWIEKFSVHPTELTQNNNPKKFSLTGQILLKISFLNGKNNSLWEIDRAFNLWQQKLSK